MMNMNILTVVTPPSIYFLLKDSATLAPKHMVYNPKHYSYLGFLELAQNLILNISQEQI